MGYTSTISEFIMRSQFFMDDNKNLYDKPLPETPDLDALRASYRCPHCAKILKGMVQYYGHLAHYHDQARPLKVGKKVSRAPLASELLEAMQAVGAGKARAARYLNVSEQYFEKWARILIPDEWASYRARPIDGIVKGSMEITKTSGYQIAEQVLAGTRTAPHTWTLYPHRRLATLQRWGLVTDSCMQCGFHEKRVSDYKSPVLIDFLDGDATNWKLDNLRVLCYNCYFLSVHDLWGKSKASALGL